MFVQLESRGVQLETLVQVFDAKGYLIDWIEFYEDAMDAKWSHSTTIKRMEYALKDVKGPAYTKEILARLIMYLKVKSGI